MWEGNCKCATELAGGDFLRVQKKFERGCYRENMLPFITEASLSSCLVLLGSDRHFAEVLALLGISSSLLSDLKEIAVETQQRASCAAFVLTQ